MKEAARVVFASTPSPDDRKIARLLEFFGVAHRSCTVAEFQSEDQRDCRVLCSAEVFTALLDAKKEIHSAFVYAAGDVGSAEAAIRRLSGNDSAQVAKLDQPARQWRVSAEQREFCGVMTGVQITDSAGMRDDGHAVARQHRGAAILSSDSGDGFIRVTQGNTPVFVSLGGSIIDIEAELETPNFDVRDHTVSVIPIVLYIRWAFPRTAWKAPEANACLIIDDPLLKPRYGWVRYEQLVRLMTEHNFATSIAFIPWNWRRSDPSVVELFKRNADKLSVCVHGCDHTAAEFGTSNPDRLRSLAADALDRMTRHQERTTLTHDEVMVYPQGVFSERAGAALKAAGFRAVVNTEVHSAPPAREKVKISDVWDTAVMRYDELPLYTRRYPRQGVENQAFDLLLGKPCFIVIHHDFCSDQCKSLVDFIDRLNALETHLVWRSPAEVVKRSYRYRELDDTLAEIEMYGADLLVENTAPHPRRFRIKRRERDPSAVDQVLAGPESMTWSADAGFLHFELVLEPAESRTISLRYRRPSAAERNGAHARSSAKTALRRYLSEVRDNYVAPAKSWLRV